MRKSNTETDRLVEAVENLGEDMRDLMEAIQQGTLLRVAEEIQTLRAAVDDLRQEIEWKSRNVIQVDDWVAQVSPINSLARDPCDPEFAKRINIVERYSLPLAPGNASATSACSEETADSQAKIKTDEVKLDVEAPVATQSPALSPKKKRNRQKQPLYLRMYAQRDIADVVRLIGYQRHDWQEFRPRLAPLMKKYGEAVIEATTEELVDVSHTDGIATVVLKPAVRKLARQLLGRPPDDEPL